MACCLTRWVPCLCGGVGGVSCVCFTCVYSNCTVITRVLFEDRSVRGTVSEKWNCFGKIYKGYAVKMRWGRVRWGREVGKHLWVGSLRPWPIVFVSDSVWGGYLIILLTFVQGRLWNSPLDPCLEKVLARPARAWLASQDWQSEAAQLNPCGAESRRCLMRLSGVRSPPLVTTSSLRVLYNSLLPNSPRSYLLYPPNFIFPFEGPESKSI